MPNFRWYIDRLKAMDKQERKLRFRQYCRRWKDWWTIPDFRSNPEGFAPAEGSYPLLPSLQDVPDTVKNSLRFDSDRILSGIWTVFRQIPLRVDRHPDWQKDYLAQVDVASIKSATHLDHRQLPQGADIKMIWEINRWTHLVRLAQEAYILNDRWTMKIAIRRVYQWAKKNPTLTGYNWTSALEAGLRLINYCWIDALTIYGSMNKKLGDETIELENALRKVRKSILPQHIWFVWRYKSFGSSANNHLLGELSGLVCALSRWPQLAKWAAPLDVVKTLWEEEVLRQFAPDGGNCEQALNYHLFSFELCWQAYLALKCAKQTVRQEVYERLQRAADFFVIVQARQEPWDYGDSDDAFVTPLWDRENEISQEWVKWMESPENDTQIKFWIGDPPPMSEKPACEDLGNGWLRFPDSGIVVCWQGLWMTRWDLSPQGLMPMAAHGHLDALHLSIWYKQAAFLIDPGTGAYYGDPKAREYLSGWSAHNSPHIPGITYPARKGSFLWGNTHPTPTFVKKSDLCMIGTLTTPHGIFERKITMIPEENTWRIDDSYKSVTGELPESDDEEPLNTMQVALQFAPECKATQIDERTFKIYRNETTSILLTIDKNWNRVTSYFPEKYEHFNVSTEDMSGICSPSFRTLQRGIRILLSGTLKRKHTFYIKGE